jgi:DNA-directed RNA polymerase specialized sigma24 family protein
VTPPPRQPDEAPADGVAPANDDAAPQSSRRFVAAGADAAPPFAAAPRSLVRAAVERYLASRDEDEGLSFIRGVVVRKLYGPKPKNVDEDLVHDIAQLAVVEALSSRHPPLLVSGVRAWTKRLTRCTIADYFRDRADDDESLAPDADPVDWSDRHAPATDWDARAHLITKYMWQAIGGDERKATTLRMMSEHENDGFSLADLARKYGTTERALANRFHKLRQEVIPKVSIMDREKPRRAILLLLLLFGMAALAALLWWLLVGAGPSSTPAVPTVAPSAVAPPGPTSRVGRLPVSHPAPADRPELDAAPSDGVAPPR